MKVSNFKNLPTGLLAACAKQRKPNPDSVSCTQLIDSPTIRRLLIKHWDELEVDVSELIAPMIGTAFHAYIQKYSDEKVSEIFMEREVDGFKVTGTCDYMESGIISDWKTAKTWGFIFGDLQEKTEKQLNVYAWLSGKQVNELEMVAIFTDWSKMEMMRNADYPRANVQQVRWKPWSDEKIEEFIHQRIAIHKDENYVCSDKERWATPDVFAVKKEGRKTAVRLFDNQAEAEALAEELGKNHSVEHRKGTHRRCEDYCSVRAVCPYRVKQEEKQDEQ